VEWPMNTTSEPQGELSDADKKEINRDLLDAILYGKDNTEKK